MKKTADRGHKHWDEVQRSEYLAIHGHLDLEALTVRTRGTDYLVDPRLPHRQLQRKPIHKHGMYIKQNGVKYYV